jgi:hypothetical protein
MALSLGLVLPCAAHISVEQIQTEISKAKILPPDMKVIAKVDGSELTLSTYKKELATVNDCKIDAVLMSKTAFDADPELSRVNVLFYDPLIPGAYDEVPVTLGDVKAYGARQLSEEQLLSALKLTRMNQNGGTAVTSNQPQPGQSGKVPSEASQAPANPPQSTDQHSDQKPSSKTDKESTASAPAAVKVASAGTASSAAAHKEPVNPGEQKSAYSAYGVTFAYPSSWRVEYPRGGNATVRFYLPAQQGTAANIEMQIYSAKDTNATALVQSDPRDTLEPEYNLSRAEGLPDSVRGFVLQEIDEWHERRNEMERRLANQGRYGDFREWLAHEHNMWTVLTPVKIAGSINAGLDKSIHCAQSAYWTSNAQGGKRFSDVLFRNRSTSRHFARLVAFSTTNGVAMLGLFCAEPDAGYVNSQFEQLLGTLQCAKVSHPAAHGAKGKGK